MDFLKKHWIAIIIFVIILALVVPNGYRYFSSPSVDKAAGVVLTFPNSNEYIAYLGGKQVEFQEALVRKGVFYGIIQGREYCAETNPLIAEGELRERGNLFPYRPDSFERQEGQKKKNPFIQGIKKSARSKAKP